MARRELLNPKKRYGRHAIRNYASSGGGGGDAKTYEVTIDVLAGTNTYPHQDPEASGTASVFNAYDSTGEAIDIGKVTPVATGFQIDYPGPTETGVTIKYII